jgi:hypothetical protein
MQVLFDDDEYRRLRRLARDQGLSMAEWVRRALRAAYHKEPLGDKDRKLAAVRAAARNSFPTGSIARMLREIAAGYSPGTD